MVTGEWLITNCQLLSFILAESILYFFKEVAFNESGTL